MGDRRVFISGASSGIGASLALCYANSCHELLLLSRRVHLLEEVKKKCLLINPHLNVRLIACDIEDFTSLKKVADEYFHQQKYIDTVIANAGLGVSGNFTDLSIEDFHLQFNPNIMGVLHTVKAFERHLLQTKGRFAVTSSALSYFVVSKNIPYCMSKFAIRALAEGLQIEWKNKVSVTHVAPGLIDTDFRLRDNKGVVHKDHPDPAPKFLIMTAYKAAKIIHQAIEKRRPEVIVTFHAKVLVFLSLYFRYFVKTFLPYIR